MPFSRSAPENSRSLHGRFVSSRPSITTLHHTLSAGDLTMKNDKEIVRIDLTPEQKQQVKKEIGKEGDSVELTVKELEERIAPIALG